MQSPRSRAMLEDFINALQNFTRNKTRTFLSLLGVIIGVASVIVITSMGQSSTKEIQATFGSSGLDLVQVSSGFMRRRRDAVTLTFDETFRQDLFDHIENIKRVWYKNSLSATLSYGDTSVTSSCTAVESGYLEMCGLALDYGDYFTVTDDVYGAQKIVLGSEVASALFPDGNAVGRTVLVVTSSVPFPFHVVGVLKEQTSGMESSTTGIYIPRGFYAKKIEPNPAASTVMIQALSPQYCTKIVTDATAYAKEKSGTDGSVNVTSMQTFIEQMNSITKTLSLMLSGIAAISLLVGGIGIMNIMLVSVTERTREIGIRKAIGADEGSILLQFLIEALMLSLLGCLLGIAASWGILRLVKVVSDYNFPMKRSVVTLATTFSMAIGLLFGFLPSLQASNLDPIEALRRE